MTGRKPLDADVATALGTHAAVRRALLRVPAGHRRAARALLTAAVAARLPDGDAS